MIVRSQVNSITGRGWTVDCCDEDSRLLLSGRGGGVGLGSQSTPSEASPIKKY
jgi:hypothetical protein